MKRFRSVHFSASILILITVCAGHLLAQNNSAPTMNMHMRGMENSVGILASGTAVEPDDTSEFSSMIQGSLGKWIVMFHANANLQSIQQTGPRGRNKFFSTNWLMPMLTRESGRHSVMIRTMLSLEPATVTKRR